MVVKSPTTTIVDEIAMSLDNPEIAIKIAAPIVAVATPTFVASTCPSKESINRMNKLGTSTDPIIFQVAIRLIPVSETLNNIGRISRKLVTAQEDINIVIYRTMLILEYLYNLIETIINNKAKTALAP